MKAEAERLDERVRKRLPNLTDYELGLLRMLSEELDPLEIASELGTSRAAVERQLALIRLKLDVDSDVQAVAVAADRGWI